MITAAWIQAKNDCMRSNKGGGRTTNLRKGGGRPPKGALLVQKGAEGALNMGFGPSDSSDPITHFSKDDPPH